MFSYPTISFDLWETIDDPAARIDRVLQDRSHRLVIGVAISQSVDRLQCALMMTDGHGKFLRLRHVVGNEVELPSVVQETWAQICASDVRSLEQVRQFMSELADFQAQAIESVSLHAGKYVDRVLAVAMTDPGLWVKDFDGSRVYCPLSDSQRVADLTGLTVMDSFPVNDILSGGRGGPLAPLPLWLAFADRQQRVANEQRVVVFADETIRAFLLPASDGHDADLPAVEMFSGDIEDLPGAIERGLERIWGRQRRQSTLIEESVSTNTTSIMRPLRVKVWIFGTSEPKNAVEKILRKTPIISQIVTQGEMESLGVSDTTYQGTVAGLLGLLHVDQLQANVPWITGAASQRVLGRLTPGTPSNWRQLVREMSDYRPPAMKLRDAV